MKKIINLGSGVGTHDGEGARSAGQKINENFTEVYDSIGLLIADSSIYNKILVSTGFSITGQELTINAGFQWLLSNLGHSNPSAEVITIPLCAYGKSRIEYVVPNNSNGFTRVSGPESATVLVAPELPNENMYITFYVVTDSAISDPVQTVVGDNYISKIEKDGWADYATTGDNAFVPAPSTGQGLLIVYDAGLNSIDGVDFSAVDEAYNGKEYIILNRTGGPITLNHFASVSAGQAGFRLLNELPLVLPDRGQVAFYNFNKIALTQTWKSWDEVTAEDLDNIYTKSETDDLLDLKLDASAYNQHFLGVYVTLAALNAAHPTASVGDYAQVNEAGATDVVNYNWDDEDSIWVAGGGTGGAANTDALPEGSTNLYFTAARVLATLLTGISFATGGAIVSTDSVLVAFGKIQKQIDDLLATGSRLITSGEITKLSNTSNTNSGDETAATIAAINHAAAAKTVLIDADEVIGQNSASSFSLIRTVWSDVWAYIRGKATADTSFMVKDVTETGTSFSLSDAYNGKVVILTASCTVTIPNGLIAGFEVSIVTLAGVTLTVALGGSVVLFNNVGTTMAEKLSCTIKNRTATNNYITAGSL